jgi:hypothetical protein
VSSNSQFIICGDFNINYLAGTCRKHQLNSLLISYNLFDTVDFPTTTQNSTTSATDNIFIGFSRQGTFVILPTDKGLSDHDAQAITIHDIGLYEQTYNIIRRINENSLNDFKYNLSFELWEDIFAETEVNIILNYFLNTFLRTFNSNFPLIRKIKNKKANARDTGWITPYLKHLCSLKKRLLFIN